MSSAISVLLARAMSAEGTPHGPPERRVIVDREADGDGRLAYVLGRIGDTL